MSGFMDFFTGKWGDELGNLLGSTGDAFGIASAFTEGKTSEGLGLGAGLASTLSGLSGLTTASGKVHKGESDAWWDVGDNLLGIGGGIADIGASSLGLQAEDENDPVKKQELLKKKGKWQMASGGLGILGGIVSGAKSIKQLYDIHKNGGSPKDKLDAWTGLAGGATKIFSGIGNIGAGAHAADDENDPKKQMWDKWGKGMSVIGAVPGLINSISGFFG